MKKNNVSRMIRTGFAATLISLSIAGYGQQTTKLSDPEVASVAVVANQIDIEYAQIALRISKNAEVVNFAQTMANDHKVVIAQAVALAKKLKVTPQTNTLTKSLLAEAEAVKKQLLAKKGKSFDLLYINNEVKYHKAVIAAVETVLIPETENAELKLLLQNVLPALIIHLSHAEMLQKLISK